MTTNTRTQPADIEEPILQLADDVTQERQGMWSGIVIGLFIVKVMSLVQCCSPYLPSGMIMWPLLALAGSDVLLYVSKPTAIADTRPRAPRRMVFFLLAHIVILSLASQYNILCPHNPTPLFIQS